MKGRIKKNKGMKESAKKCRKGTMKWTIRRKRGTEGREKT